MPIFVSANRMVRSVLDYVFEMRYVSLPGEESRHLPFYLAMEEHLARNLALPEDLFFMWQVEPTVIFGRNQIIDNEVDIEYCRRNGIRMYRRRSGGGCVFANRDNIMFSYVTPRRREEVATVFGHYTSMVAGMLRGLGLNAEASSRNDICIDGLKVSGNAFYHTPTHSIVHGTMLFDTDMGKMANAITPSKTKLKAKGVESVRSHITTLRQHLTMSLDEFKAHARHALCDGELRLGADDVAAIEALERPYYEEGWIYRKRPDGQRRDSRRIEGAGEFRVDLTTDTRGLIADLDLAGDFFLMADMDELIVERLRGVRYDREAVAEALKGVDVGNVIYGLDNEQLMKLLF